MKKIKKFINFDRNEFVLVEGINVNDMEIGLDLTKIHSDEWVIQKTIEFLKENKHK